MSSSWLRNIQQKASPLGPSEITNGKIATEDVFKVFQFLIDTSSEMIFWTDEGGAFLDFNDRTCEILGYSRSELSSMRVRDIDPEITDDSHAEFLSMLRKSQSVTVQTQPRRKDGTFFTMEFTVARLLIEDRVYLCTHGREIVLERHLRDRVLEAIAKNQHIDEVLSLIIQLAENTRDELCASIMILNDDQTLRTAGKTSLPDGFCQQLAGLVPNKNALSCGTAAFTSRSVLVNDISKSPLWDSLQKEAEIAGLHACWSEPIFSSKNKVLGTFALYFQTPQMPNQYDRELMKTFAYLAGIAIERSQETESLLKNERQLRLITDSLPVMILYVDQEYRLQFHNATGEKAMNVTREASLGRPISEFIGNDAFEYALPHLENAFAGHVTQFEQRYNIAESPTIYDVRLIPDVAPDGTVSGIYVLADDITLRRALEKEAINSSAKTQTRIGQDLHDGVGQELTGLGMIADTLQLSLARNKSDEAPLAEKLAKGVKRSLQQVRLLSRGLNPVDVSSDGLRSALTEMANHVEDLYGIKCRVRYDMTLRKPDDQVATQLFRIAQEATTNAAKHGLAKFVSISLVARGNDVMLSVTDDGVGFEPARADNQGMGIRSMNYRAGLIGGRLTIAKRTTGGTELQCCIPPIQFGEQPPSQDSPN